MEQNIRIWCDEEMRAHFEFVMRRYLNDMRVGRAKSKVALAQYESEIALSERCLREAQVAGT